MNKQSERSLRYRVKLQTRFLSNLLYISRSPYMAPEPFRGKRNDPGKLYRMAEKLAQIRGLTVEEIEKITTENGKRLYRI